MKISLNWLSDLVDIKPNLDTEELAWRLTESSAEIEHIIKKGDNLNKIVVGEVIESEKHPDADKLTVNKIDAGDGKILPVVCGAPNMRSGIKVALALVGAEVLWHGEGKPVVMEKTKIRGEVSEGMACAPEEIGLSDMFDTDGIIELDTDAPAGTPLAEALNLNDTIFDIDNHAITHRPDLFSHRGFAREISALGLGDLKIKELVAPSCTGDLPFKLTLNEKAMPSYAGIVIKNVKNIDSPDWMKTRLASCGIRSLGLLVDITNYVMLELGMPLHAFDLRTLDGKELNFRLSKSGEKVKTLDGIERELDENIIIADNGTDIIDLCGIMGGENSGIKDDTTDIFLHSPVYDSVLIRRGMISLRHRTDAGTIYEKGIDPFLAKDGLLRAMEIIKEVLPESIFASKIISENNNNTPPSSIKITKEYLNTLIGSEVSEDEIKSIEKLGIKVEISSDEIIATPPTYRRDLTIPADIAEEIARLKGYNTIEESLPNIAMRSPEPQPQREVEKIIRNTLLGLGLDETVNYSLLGKKLLASSGMQDKEDSLIEIMNAVSEDFAYFRPHLLPRLLETAQRNIYADTKDIRIFEIGKVAELEGDKFTEKTDCGIIFMPKDSENIFYEAKGIAEEILRTLDIDFSSKPTSITRNYLHPARIAELCVDDAILGYVAEIHPLVLDNFDIKNKVAVIMLDTESLAKHKKDELTQVAPLPEYPSIERDISALFDIKTEVGSLLANLITTSDLLENVELFDVYTDKKLEQDEKKSLAFRFIYRADDKTLTDEEIEKEFEKAVNLLEKSGAEIRK